MPESLSRALSIPADHIHPVHRLDRTTGGVMVYALDASTAAAMSRDMANHRFHKRYLAVAESAPADAQGTWTDLLYWDRVRQKSYVVDRVRKGVKEAELAYRILAVSEQQHALCAVDLSTGRTHQIRVQFASRGYPLLGDRRYGGHGSASIALWAYRLAFPDPKTGKELTFSAFPPSMDPWNDPAFTAFFSEGNMI